MTQGQRDAIDLGDYKRVKCRLCKGSRQLNGTDCPSCDGEGAMPRWAYDATDWSRFELVKCPLCHGSGTLLGSDCGRCDGEGTIFRQDADRDW
jgi:DnaJ-class molecular chaperone